MCMTATFISLGLIYLFPVPNFQSLLLDSSRCSMTCTKYDTSFILNFLSFKFLFPLMISVSLSHASSKPHCLSYLPLQLVANYYLSFLNNILLYLFPYPLLVHTFITFHLNSNNCVLTSLQLFHYCSTYC